MKKEKENISNIEEYLLKIRSAVEKLFEAHYSYLELLKEANSIVSPWCYGNTDKEVDEQLKNYMNKHRDKIIIGVNAIRKFEAEGFAQAIICGAIFQLAYMAIELFSENEDIPDNLQELNEHKKAVEKFCIGREIFNNVPLGLFIFLGKNIYNHYDDSTLRKYNQLILNRLPDGGHQYKDLDIINKLYIVENLFGNTGMKDYNSFCNELKDMLK